MPSTTTAATSPGLRFVVLPSLGETTDLLLPDGTIVIPDHGSPEENLRAAKAAALAYGIPYQGA